MATTGTAPGASAPPSFADMLSNYQRTASVARQNRTSGRDANVAAAVFGAYTSSQPGGANYNQNMVRRPGDSVPDWQRPDAPKFGVYSGVYGTNKSPFSPTNITKDGRPAYLADQSPFERITGQNLSTIGAQAQAAANQKNQEAGNYSPGKVEFGSVGKDPVADMLGGNVDLTGPKGGQNAQDYRKGIVNAAYKSQHSPWSDVPYLWKDQMDYMMARTPQNAATTASTQRMWDVGAMTPQQRAQEVTSASGAAAKAGDYGTPDSVFNLFAPSGGFNENSGLQAKGLYAMGVPGSQPYSGWFDAWNTTPPPTHYTTGQVASPILAQIRNTAKINRRDFAPQGQTPIPSVAPATTPTFTPAFQATPDRSARVAAPSASLRPDAYYAQAPTRRYGLKSSGGSPLLDAMMKPKPLFGV